MNWFDNINSCFGAVDRIFANHPSDQQNAKTMVKLAKQQGASFDDVRTALEKYINEKVKDDEMKIGLITKQNKELKRIWALKRL